MLVTDAVMPAMCKPGFYRLGSVEVELQEGNRVVLRNAATGWLGLRLRMDHAIGNAVEMARISLREALAHGDCQSCTGVPDRRKTARTAAGRKGRSWFALDGRGIASLTVIETIVTANTVYTRE